MTSVTNNYWNGIHKGENTDDVRFRKRGTKGRNISLHSAVNQYSKDASDSGRLLEPKQHLDFTNRLKTENIINPYISIRRISWALNKDAQQGRSLFKSAS